MTRFGMGVAEMEHIAELMGHYITAVGDVATAFRPLSFGLVIVFVAVGLAFRDRRVRSCGDCDDNCDQSSCDTTGAAKGPASGLEPIY